MAVIETWYNQDLQNPVNVHYLDGSLFSHNGNGNRIGVHVFNNGEPATLTGTVSGYVITADGSTVPCTGTRSGNNASILIPAAAYQPGAVFITLFITDGTTVTTIASVATSVLTARTNNQVDPGSVVTDWTQTINAAMQSVETAAEDLGGIVAVPYANITFPVPLGKYTYYNGGLYRCISAIASSESFTPAHWTAVRLGDDVADLKSALNYSVNYAMVEAEKTVTWQNGYIDQHGLIKSSSLSGFALVPMLAGETLKIGTANNNITIIGSTTAESISVGDTVTVIQTTTASGNFEEYTYTADVNINIVVCVRLSDYILNFYKKAEFINPILDEIYKCYNGINLIGLDSSVYYPVIIPTGTTLTMSTADGTAIGQNGLNLLFYDSNKNDISGGGWNFNSAYSERTITVINGGNTAYFVKWNINPVKAVQLEIGSEKTAYKEYSLPINDPAIIKQILNPVPDGLTEEDIFNGEPYSGSYDWQTPVVNYGALFKGKTNVETFAFFTDPHIMGFGDSDRNETNMQEYIKKASKVIRSVPCKSTVCGGDWLNNNTTMDEACYRLGYIKALAKNMLCDCKLVNGNHDTNYQGKRDSESEVSTGRLTDATIAALMFNDTDTRKAYYSFDGIRSKCYVLDTGIEHSDMTAYDWEQIAWLAGKLAEDDSEHSIIFLHIITNNGNVQTNTSNFATLVEAYNEHTTVTLNSITYDFTSCTGKVELWVGGHTHIDSNGTLGGIPYIITASLSYGSYVPLIDLMLVDYDNHVLRTIRAGGTGSDRTIALAT